MKVIIAPDSFKGTFSSLEVIDYLSDGFNKHFDNVEIVPIPIADGGEGTVDAVLRAKQGVRKDVVTSGPLDQPVSNYFGMIGETAVIEMASTSGITLIGEDERNPLYTNTYGTGELMIKALDEGAKKIVVGIGGSATNDGGTGMARALGVKFFDAVGQEVGLGGQDLEKIRKVDLSGIDKRILDVDVEVICDVTNPLCGERGATYVYGPQKGATEDMLAKLEKGMTNFHQVIEDQFGLTLNAIPGSGAAGGLGGGLVAFAGAELKKGVETMLDIVGFDQLVQDADLVITGEGMLDHQSVYGKVPVGVASRCGDKPVIAFVGACGEGYEAAYDHNISSVFSTVNQVTDFPTIVANKKEIMTKSVDQFMRLLKSGRCVGDGGAK